MGETRIRRKFRSLLAGAAALTMLASCAGAPQTDLVRLYGNQAGNPDQPPVVIVHGALGSRLARVDGGGEVWPGSLRRILFSDYRSLMLQIDPQTLEPRSSALQPTDVAKRVGGVDFYGRILDALDAAGGYRPGRPGEPVSRGDRRYYVFMYDWRQDNIETVRELDRFVESIRSDYNDPQLKVDIVAHSMGGLVTRYFIRYGTQDLLDGNEFPVTQEGAQKVRRVVLLGTPNLGSIGALRTLIEGYKVGFGVIPPEVTATFPSTYQVLPHALSDWFVTIDGTVLQRDQFSAAQFWRRFRFSIFDSAARERIREGFDTDAEYDAYVAVLERYFDKQLERARRFSWSLTVNVDEPQVRYIVFGGDCIPTSARAVVEDVDGESFLRLRPGDIENPLGEVDYELLMLEPGDGTVTKASLLARQTADPTVARHKYSFFPIDYPVFLCERHGQLTGNRDFQNNLLHALLSVDR